MSLQQNSNDNLISAKGLFFCKCCGYNTLSEFPNGTFEICEICFWEDDIIQSNNPNYEGGSNRISLNHAKENFEKFGACEESMIKNVRKPSIDDIRISSEKNDDFQIGMKVKLENDYGIVTDDKVGNLYGVILWDDVILRKENWCGLFGSFKDSGGEILDYDYKFKYI